jgi:hypothetical protein
VPSLGAISSGTPRENNMEHISLLERAFLHSIISYDIPFEKLIFHLLSTCDN